MSDVIDLVDPEDFETVWRLSRHAGPEPFCRRYRELRSRAFGDVKPGRDAEAAWQRVLDAVEDLLRTGDFKQPTRPRDPSVAQQWHEAQLERRMLKTTLGLYRAASSLPGEDARLKMIRVADAYGQARRPRRAR